MLKKYLVIDYVADDWYYYNDDIELGFALDRIMDTYIYYDLPIRVYSYNYGKVYVIKMKERGE